MRLLWDLELSRKDSFEQLRKEKEQSDLRIQEHIQRLEAKEQEREARKRGHSRRNPSQEKQTPKIPNFYGGSDPKVFLDWEAKVDQIFNENHVKDQAQVDLVVLGFLEYANTWWHKVCKNYDQGPPTASWMDIKTLMRTRFFPPSYRKELLLKLQRLHQGPMSVSEYFKELESQMHRVEIKETNKEKIKRFVSGLRRDIQDQVELYEYSTLENVFTLALGIEIQLKRKRRAKKTYSPNHYFSHSWKGNDKKKHDKFPSNSHQEPPSKSKSPSDHIHHSTSQRSSSIKCFKCLGYNHITLNCPTKRSMILKKSNDVESEHSSPHSLSKESSSSSKTKIF